VPPKRGAAPGKSRGEVPIVGPTPDHAQAYFPPKTVPPPTDHRTIEIATVRLAPEIDPRCVATQRSLPRMRPPANGGRLPSGRPSVRPVTLPSGGHRRPRVATISRPVWALLGVAVALAVAVLVRLAVQRVPSISPDSASRLPQPVREHAARHAHQRTPLPGAGVERRAAVGASFAHTPQRVASAPSGALPRESAVHSSAATTDFRSGPAVKQTAAVSAAPPRVPPALRAELSPTIPSAGRSPADGDAHGRPAGKAQEPTLATGTAESPGGTEPATQSTDSQPAPRSRRPSFF